MAKQKRLFETALQAQQSCLEEARRLLLQAEQKARELKASDRFAEEYKREELKKLADTVSCLLYTSDAADDLPCVDLGGRRIIKKKKQLYRPRFVQTHIHTKPHRI